MHTLAVISELRHKAYCSVRVWSLCFRALHPSRRREERMDSTFLCWNRLRLHAYTCTQSRNEFP